jgi:hypothetical protein
MKSGQTLSGAFAIYDLIAVARALRPVSTIQGFSVTGFTVSAHRSHLTRKPQRSQNRGIAPRIVAPTVSRRMTLSNVGPAVDEHPHVTPVLAT